MPRIQVRARAVDMLGRQQIAGIPTALHELFKNAHDAYADHVEVDFFRVDGALLIRDDGIGMTPEEFETRWLTLGTESKLGGSSGTPPPYRDPNKPERAILGEKGIGRLAIAAIGHQVLVLTRAERNGKLHDLVACFIHWGLFEIAGLDLSDIEIPVEKWTQPGLPDEAFIEGMTAKVSENVQSLGKRIPDRNRNAILQELADFRIAPDQLYPHIGGLSLDDTRGTHFFVRPVDPILESDIDETGSDFASPLKKNLVGFCNTMLPNAPVPAVQIAFRDHRHDGGVHDLVDPEEEFFTPSDFKSADHHFEGEFDEFGQFSGQIQIYGGKPTKYILAWPGARGHQTKCGSFRLKMAYVQGLQSESRLPPELYGPLTKKLDQIGGLYIYCDGIRILPYGNSDYDWVNMERRRTKAAKDYFFSYRRVFGAVLITREANSHLIEKAGREGFMENTAYRQMRDMIQHFLIEVVREHFRQSSTQAEDYWFVKRDLQRQHDLLKKREKRVAVRKKAFAAELGNFFQRLEADKPAIESNAIETDAVTKLDAISALGNTDPEEAGRQLLRLEAKLRDRLTDLRKHYTVTRPRGIGLTKNQVKNWNAYLFEFAELEKQQFGSLQDRLRSAVTQAIAAMSGVVDRRRRIDQALEGIQQQTQNQAHRVRRETNDEVGTLKERVVAEVREHMSVLQNSLKKTFAEFERTDVSGLPDDELDALQTRLELELEEVAAHEIGSLQSIHDQLAMLNEAIVNNESIADVTTALEERAETFRSQVDLYAEMAQIGTAVGIIQHEFVSTFSLMRNYIRQLRGWAQTNPQLEEIYKHIRNNFQHLDEYMNMFKPFSRRLHRRKVDIPGQEIRYYLMRLFEDRFERHDVALIGTRAFDNTSVHAYPSTIYPCFVNLVDNAIYWLTKEIDGRPRVAKGRKEIYLDADDSGLLVSDNGPGVERRISKRIFDFGYSRKRNGRGMGLYISREILRRDNLDLVLNRPDRGKRSAFRIVTGSTDDGGEHVE
ncbi:MAG: ATP-binding protein [Candidatus Aegiribacteria sp.]|nr:ATP-binding protein [Candidatus Aegiribacteria sp.]